MQNLCFGRLFCEHGDPIGAFGYIYGCLGAAMDGREEAGALSAEYLGSNVLEAGLSNKLVIRAPEEGCKGKCMGVWSADILPHSWYQEQLSCRRRGKRYMEKIRKAEARDIYHISPRRLSRALTSLDLAILRRITPNELVEHDGAGSRCRNIRHMRSKNAGLTSFVAQELARTGNYGYFFRVLRHLERAGNYNSFYCVVQALQMQRLDLKRLRMLSGHVERGTSYFDMRQVLDELTASEAFLICPMDVYIKDVEESNRTRNNEVASMRFCRLVEILIKLQNQALDEGISHSDEHFLLSRIWGHLQSGAAPPRQAGSKKHDGQFLLI